MKKTVRDIAVSGKRVLVRVDFNVPIEHGTILDDGRIRAALPTIRYLIEHQARVILLSHLGRPNGRVVEELRMNPIASRLADLLGQPVYKVSNCIGPEVQEAVKGQGNGQVLMLENVRFHPGEMVNDARFAAKLASIADVFVNDAFATIHRAHASTTAIAKHLPAVAGLLVESEIKGLHQAASSMSEPIITVLGGDKVVEKLNFIQYSLRQSKRVLVGGIVGHTFLKASGLETGNSQIDQDAVHLARLILGNAADKLVMPVDVVVANSPMPLADSKTVPVERIPATGWIVDIGPQTVRLFQQHLREAHTVIWNGPLGKWEEAAFAVGTLAIAHEIAGLKAVKIAGGGDTIAALDQAGVAEKVDYLSTGSTAFLDALQDKDLPGMDVLLDQEEQDRAIHVEWNSS